MRILLMAGVAAFLIQLQPGTEPRASAQASRAVIVEDVAKYSAGERAGLRPGDELRAWTTLRPPSSGNAPTQGELRTPFDLAAVETEEAARGVVILSAVRNGKPFKAKVPPGEWKIDGRPEMPPDVVTLYEHARALVDKPDAGAAVASWTDAANRFEKSDPERMVWLWVRASAAFRDARAWDAAHGAATTAIAAAERIGNRILLANAWDAEALVFERQNDFPRARTAYATALRVREQIRPESLSVAKTLINVGAQAYQHDDLADAEELFTRALRIRERLAPNSVAVARTLHNLATVSETRGQLDEAAERLARATEIMSAVVPESRDHALTVRAAGNLAWKRGDLDAAFASYHSALAILERIAPGSLDVAGTVQNLALVAEDRGDLSQAEQLYSRAIQILERESPGGRDLATALGNLAGIAADRGDLVRAEELHRRALAINERIAPGGLGVAENLHNLGRIASHRGDKATAERLYKQDLEITERLAPDSVDLAKTLNSLAAVVGDLGRADEAEGLHRRALSILEAKTPGTRNVVATLNNLGELAQARGHLDDAASFYERAVGIAQQLAPEGLDTTVIVGNMSELAFQRGDTAKAEALRRQQLAVASKRFPGTTLEAEAWYRLAVIARKANRHDEAEAAFDRAIRALDTQAASLGGAEEIRSAFRARYTDVYHEYIGLLVADGKPQAAVSVVERSRARSFLAMLAERDLVLPSELPQDIERTRREIDTEYERTQAALAVADTKPADVEQLTGRLRELRDRREALIATVRKLSPRFAALRYPEPLDLSRIEATLDPGTVLLSYAIGQEQSFMFVIGPNRSTGNVMFSAIPLSTNEASLRALIDKFRRLIERGGSAGDTDSQSLREAGRELYRLLIGPAQARIDEAERVVISPDGPLHALPFAALVEPSDGPGRYFIEAKPIHTVLSATVYAELQKLRQRPTTSRPVLVAFGDATYVPSSRGAAVDDPEVRETVRRGYGLEPLPATRAEVGALGKLYGASAVIYTGLQATEENAKTAIGRARYVHFAAHALLDEEFPLDSALVLTIPRGAQHRENGLLHAWEVMEQIRLTADLVTLSACSTALGKELGGEGLIGLTRAFQFAGAHSIVASLWSVDDESTATLMTRFYRHLKAGRTKDAALRAAQVEMIHEGRSGAAAAQPFHWAPFVLFGDWR